MNNCKRCGKLLENKKSDYCSHSCHGLLQTDQKIEKFLAGGYVNKQLIFSGGRWPRRVLEEKLGLVCNSCGIGEIWNDKPITLEVNHIDGFAYNNVIENLEFLCPNCHSQTDTYRNKGSRVSDRTNRKKK